MTLIIIILHNECEDQLVHDYRASSVPEMKINARCYKQYTAGGRVSCVGLTLAHTSHASIVQSSNVFLC